MSYNFTISRRLNISSFSKGFSFIEIMVGALVGAIVVFGVFRLSKSVIHQSQSEFSSSTLDTELSRFEQLMMTDLARAGSDPTERALFAYQYAPGQPCEEQYFPFGLVMYPTDSHCEEILGQLGILSYQGLDINHNGVFYPEEGLDFVNAGLRPPAPQGISPAPPEPLPVNFYNDYIIYQWMTDQNQIVRKNMGSLETTENDFSEVVLRNVIQFSLDFEQVGYDKSDVNPGALFGKITVDVMVKGGQVDPSYTNPNLGATSPYIHTHTRSKKFSFQVINHVRAIN